MTRQTHDTPMTVPVPDPIDLSELDPNAEIEIETLPLASFVQKVGKSPKHFVDNPSQLTLDMEPEASIYRHAAYIVQVIQFIDQDDILDYKLGEEFMPFEAGELQYSGQSGRSTFWNQEGNETGSYIVRQNEDESMSFYHVSMTSEQVGHFNRDRQQQFLRFNDRLIKSANTMVVESAPRRIDNQQRRYYTALAESMGSKNRHQASYYSYHGDTPFGESWGRIGVAMTMISEEEEEARFEMVQAYFQRRYGDEGLDQFWVIERDSHWAVRWIDYIGIQFFFSQDHMYTLTPIAVDFLKNVYDRWQYWDIPKNANDPNEQSSDDDYDYDDDDDFYKDDDY